MYTKELPPFSVLRQLLDYNAETGQLTWLPRGIEHFAQWGDRAVNVWATWNTRYAGTAALNTLTKFGYRTGKIKALSYQAHRICWVWFHGEEPEYIDHINGNASDNRISNLRSVSWGENCKNRSLPKSNKSGVIGVHWCTTHKWWVAAGHKDGKRRQLGVFKRKEDAIARRARYESEMGFHPNHGRVAI